MTSDAERMCSGCPFFSALCALKSVQLARQQGRVTVREVEKTTGANRNTIKTHIKKLVQKGELNPMGIGKGTWHKLSCLLCLLRLFAAIFCFVTEKSGLEST